VVQFILCVSAPLHENKRVFKTVRHLLELIRFSHTIFALPFALLAAVMAWRLQSIDRHIGPDPNTVQSIDDVLDVTAERVMDLLEARLNGEWLLIRWQDVVGILLCMVAARSFAMSMNRLADLRLDAQNPRTAGRHLQAGILSVPQVVAFAVACAIVFVVSTLWFLPNWLPLACSIPVLAFLAGYSYAKRFTSMAHVWLGAALGLSPVAAWVAIRGLTVIQQPLDVVPAVVLGGAVLTWVAGFDIIYACQDYEADIKAKLHSIPVRLGVPGALRLAAACHFCTVVLLACLPLAYPLFGWIYWCGVAAVAVLLAYEHLLVRPDDLSRVNAAFFNVNAVISLGLFAVGTLDLWVGGGG
jgi:4-hydroxybenzoate polyprenyltransferase